MATYLFRLGDGNEGNFPRFTINTDKPFAALRALVLNRYILGPMRDHISTELQVEGEEEYGIDAWVFEGPNGEQAFGAAWLTAELEPADDDPDAQTLADVLDDEAMADYTAHCAKE